MTLRNALGVAVPPSCHDVRPERYSFRPTVVPVVIVVVDPGWVRPGVVTVVVLPGVTVVVVPLGVVTVVVRPGVVTVVVLPGVVCTVVLSGVVVVVVTVTVWRLPPPKPPVPW